MDVNTLVEVLRATLVPDQREQAEQELNKVSENMGRILIPVSRVILTHEDCSFNEHATPRCPV